MRLIDAEAWKLDLLLLHGTDERTAWIINRINHAPTVDAVTVIHGKWIYRDVDGWVRPFWERYMCSVCGDASDNFNYCPNCGAKMDGVEE